MFDVLRAKVAVNARPLESIKVLNIMENEMDKDIKSCSWAEEHRPR